MNTTQQKIAKLQNKVASFELLLEKEVWTAEESSQYGNKETLEVEKQLVEVSIQLLVVEDLFERGYTNWTSNEKDRYGSEKEVAFDQLRKKEEQLRKEKEQLRKEKEQLRKRKEVLLQIKFKETASTDQNTALTMMTELFTNRYKFDGKSTSAGKRKIFKPLLVRDYFQIVPKVYHNGVSICSQILNIELPKFLVVGAHIFKHEWAGDAEILLGITNIDSTRNGLLLFQPIENAFNRSKLCFVKEDGEDSFRLKILDPSLREKDLLSSCLNFISKEACEKLNLSVTDVRNTVSSALDNNGRQTTFGDLEGRSLICKGKTRPYKRCLNFHASRARDYAIEMGWISSNVTFKYSWSQNFDEIGLKKYLDSLGGSYDDPNARNISDERLANVTIEDDESEIISISDVS